MAAHRISGIELSSLNIGQTETFDLIFRSYYAPLCHFAAHFLQSEEEAQDIIEDLFIKLWQKNQVFENPKHAQAFLYRSAQNACLNFLKHNQRTTIAQEALITDTDWTEEDYLSQMIRSEVWGEIYRAIEGLPAQCSKVIVMSYIDGKSNSEIAEELDLSVQTVKNHKARGLSLLRTLLPGNLLMLLILHSYWK